MSQLLVQNYLNEIDRLRRYTGSVTEGVISEAFKDLLQAWSRQLNWQFSAQYEFATTQRSYPPFVRKSLLLDPDLISILFKALSLKPSQLTRSEMPPLIAFHGMQSRQPFTTLLVSAPFDICLLKTGNGSSLGLPRYRYASTGERIDNITDWALKQFRAAYAKDGRGAEAAISPLEGEMGGSPEGGAQVPDSPQGGVSRGVDVSREAPPSVLPDISPSRGEIGRSAGAPSRGEIGKSPKARQIGKDDIFHYVYAVLHDPVYRERYAINLKREFPRIPFYPDFWRWAAWGKRLMALHIGYESVEPWPLKRTDTPDEKARAAGVAPKAMLKADRDNGIIRLDGETTLSGIPAAAWDYRLGNRSGLEWILDQYKEKTPKDPTIREKFNTYRFADHKEKVADLLMRVTRVSVETVAVTEAMKEARR